MLKQDADWWKPRGFSRAWRNGHASRLSNMPKNNPYRREEDSLSDFFDWSNGYNAACKECINEHEHLMQYDEEYREHFEILTMRAYWQGLHWETERFTDNNDNPYLDAQEPRQELIDAWYQGRRDAKAVHR